MTTNTSGPSCERCSTNVAERMVVSKKPSNRTLESRSYLRQSPTRWWWWQQQQRQRGGEGAMRPAAIGAAKSREGDTQWEGRGLVKELKGNKGLVHWA